MSLPDDIDKSAADIVNARSDVVFVEMFMSSRWEPVHTVHISEDVLARLDYYWEDGSLDYALIDDVQNATAPLAKVHARKPVGGGPACGKRGRVATCPLEITCIRCLPGYAAWREYLV